MKKWKLLYVIVSLLPMLDLWHMCEKMLQTWHILCPTCFCWTSRK